MARGTGLYNFMLISYSCRISLSVFAQLVLYVHGDVGVWCVVATVLPRRGKRACSIVVFAWATVMSPPPPCLIQVLAAVTSVLLGWPFVALIFVPLACHALLRHGAKRTLYWGISTGVSVLVRLL